MTSAIRQFREFVTDIRKPAPYFPVATELKGLANLVFGSMQLIASQYMKYSKQPHLNQLSARHVRIGKEAVYIGCKQFVPGFLFAMCVRYFASRLVKSSASIAKVMIHGPLRGQLLKNSPS